MSKKNIDNLFEQTKDLKIIGERLSGETEIVHEIEDSFRSVEFYPIVRNQIKTILEFVPLIFPQDWKSPDEYIKLSPEQQEAYKKIKTSGIQACPGPVIQRVIELAVHYQKQYSNNKKKDD